MKISTETTHPYTSQRAQTPSATSAKATSFAARLATATGENSTGKQVDFANMTRQDLFDWMNNQIRSGKMSLDESSPFLGMTMKVAVAAGPQSSEMAADTTRINFIEKARLGIEGALSRNDQDLANRLTMAIDLMRRASP